jgi:hypothetical protein
LSELSFYVFALSTHNYVINCTSFFVVQVAFLPTMVEGVNLNELIQALKTGNRGDYGGRFVRKLNAY